MACSCSCRCRETHLIDLHSNQEVVVLQIHSVRLPDEPGERLDDSISLHRIVVPHVRAYAELQSSRLCVSHVVPDICMVISTKQCNASFTTYLLRRHRRPMEVRRQHLLRYLLQSLHRRLAHQSHRRQSLRRPRPLVHRVRHGILADLVNETDRLDRSDGFEEHHCESDRVSFSLFCLFSSMISELEREKGRM